MIRRALPLWLLIAACAPALVAAPRLQRPPDLEQRVGWAQRLGAQVPTDLHFRDSDGHEIRLDSIARDKPLLLMLGYYRCPHLCDVDLNGLAVAAGRLRLHAGSDYAIAFVSIDPHETPANAANAAHRLASAHPDAGIGRWHLLTGDSASIRALADAVGFRFFHDARNDEYAHPAGAVVLTGHGRIAQYFFGVAFAPAALRLALVDASRGRLGSLIDQLVLLCCGYDPASGRYSLLIGRTMMVFGVGFALALASLLLLASRRNAA